jgi:hypothetical protein
MIRKPLRNLETAMDQISASMVMLARVLIDVMS